MDIYIEEQRESMSAVPYIMFCSAVVVVVVHAPLLPSFLPPESQSCGDRGSGSLSLKIDRLRCLGNYVPVPLVHGAGKRAAGLVDCTYAES